jgi:hypothetical protein
MPKMPQIRRNNPEIAVTASAGRRALGWDSVDTK